MNRFYRPLAWLVALQLLFPSLGMAEATPPDSSASVVVTESSAEIQADSQPSTTTDTSDAVTDDSIAADDFSPTLPDSSSELTGEAEGNTPDEELNNEDSFSNASDPTDVVLPDDKSEENTETDVPIGGDAALEEEEKNEKEEEPQVTKKPSSKKSSGTSGSKTRTNAIYEGVTVSVEELGTIHSRIKLDGEQIDVLTEELIFQEVDDERLQLAYIIAPKTGRSAMRDQAAKSEAIARYCDAGDLAIVLGMDGDFTRILYKGAKGYVLHDTLQLIEHPEEDGAYALLCVDGRTAGGATVNIRNLPDRNSCKIAEWAIGTEVTVWSYTEGWYEIEAKGMRGYVMEAYVAIEPGV